ncbi:MAG TPA: heavy-metal-associated domain-containing protein [Thermoanaerobaculia bacterium]|nr:heavy-metal-associated domain-containing protein [Thermoanaerobaculia bacterium]
MTTTKLEIEGMSCDHCVRAVTGALEGVTGVERAEVDLQAGRARVEHDPLRAGVDQLLAAVAEEGYAAHLAAP